MNPTVVPVGLKPRSQEEVTRGLWREIHGYTGSNPESFYKQWSPRIPSVGCKCKEHWSKIEAANPPDFSSDQAFFEWSVARHNDVNKKLGKHVLDLEEAYSLYRPRKFAPNSMDPYCYAVTSLSQNPKHLEVQEKCLNTWIDFGLRIYSVNSEDEIKALKGKYPQVHEFIKCELEPTAYSRPTPRMQQLTKVAIDLDHPIITINSDIEIYAPQDYLKPDEDSFLAGMRWNYDKTRDETIEFEWGLDVFSFTPEQARCIPEDLPYAIGFPMWDYVLPHIMQKNGFEAKHLHKRHLFHKNHKVFWDQDSLKFGWEWANKNLGTAPRTQPEWAAWRKSLEPNKVYTKGAFVDRPKRVAFNHIAKCAGSSVTTWLKAQPFRSKWQTNGDDPVPSVVQFMSNPVVADLYTGHEIDSILYMLPEDTIKATVLRHPVDRIKSLYSYFIQIGKTDLPFDQWVKPEAQQLRIYSNMGGVSGTLRKYDVVGFADDLEGFARELADKAGFLYSPIGRENRGEYPVKVEDDLHELLKDEIEIYKELKSMVYKG